MRGLSLSIRGAGPGDRGFIAALAEQVFGHLGDYRRILIGAYDDPDVWVHILLCAERRAGFALSLPDNPVNLLAIAVEPAFRRNGLGRYLLERVLSDAELVKKHVVLAVAKENVGAQALFRGAGLVPTGERSEYPFGSVALHFSQQNGASCAAERV